MLWSTISSFIGIEIIYLGNFTKKKGNTNKYTLKINYNYEKPFISIFSGLYLWQFRMMQKVTIFIFSQS